MPAENNLGGSAAKLLLHLARRGGAWGTSAEMMCGAGLVNRGGYYSARRELEGVALSDFRTQVSEKWTRASENRTPPVRIVDTPVRTTDTPVRITGTPLSEEWTSLGWVEETVSILSQCVEADRMPDGGNKMQPNSPFASRRRAQVQALQAGFAEQFPGEQLSEVDAKEYLRCCDNSAEAAYEAVQGVKAKAKKIDSPKAYIRSALQRMAAEVRAEPAAVASTVKPLPSAPLTDEKPPPTPEMRAKWERNARLLEANGIKWRDD